MGEDERPLGTVARRLAATRRVLAVEDEHDIADFLRAYFRAAGYDLVHVDPSSATEVVEAVEEHRPDIVLLDLNLRGFNGAEAYRLLRDDPRHAFLPLIVVSARPDAQSLVPARGGIDAFVSKPFHVRSLAELVEERMESARRLAEKTRVHTPTGLRGQEYVEARLTDEINVAGRGQQTSFAIVRLLTLAEIRSQVGDSGLDFVIERLVDAARSALPAGGALGLTQGDELAVVLPATGAAKARLLLTDVIEPLTSMALPGGAEVPLRFAAGLATHPTHGADADAVYMAADAALTEAVDQGTLLAVAL
jgi:PleD family two-component response regulator